MNLKYILKRKKEIMAKVQNVELSYNDIFHAIQSSEKIQKSLDRQLELQKEIEKYRDAQSAHRIRNPFLRLVNEFLKNTLGIDLSPAPAIPEDLKKEFNEQKKMFDTAARDVLNTIRKMEYVRMVQLGISQTDAKNLVKKYRISEPEKFKELILGEYETDYREAMKNNETPIKYTNLREWEIEEKNLRKTTVRDDCMRLAHKLQLNLVTSDRTLDSEGNYHQNFVYDVNETHIEGDLYSPEDTNKLREELDDVSHTVDRMLNKDFKDILPKIKELEEHAKDAGCFLQISKDGVLSLSYFDEMGDEHVPYSVSLDGNESVFFEECLANIGIREQEIEKSLNDNDYNVLEYEDISPASNLEENLDQWDSGQSDGDNRFIDPDMLYDIADDMDDLAP